jgi:Cu2+-exporting ATPase
MTQLAGTTVNARATADHPPPAAGMCRHCGLPAHGQAFCCAGCRAAHDLIQGLGLGGYYLTRLLDPAERALKPDVQPRTDLDRHNTTSKDGTHSLLLAIDGLQCGACIWLIEAVLAREPDVTAGRVNMTTRRLRLAWHGDASRGAALCAAIESLGYKLTPFDPACVAGPDRAGRALLRALAVAGFAAGNVMLISLGTWFGATQNMGHATLQLMHWLSALVAMPAIAYAGRPFFASALGALRHGRTNMDVPISVGVILVTATSLWQTIAGRPHAYFDSAVTLLFFLLIGRVLDQRARAQARSTADRLLLLRAQDVAVLQPDGTLRRVAQSQVAVNDSVLATTGERIGVDGTLLSASATLDTSLVTGESLPETFAAGGKIFAGSINLGPSITMRVSATGEATLLAECVRMIEAAESARGAFVMMTDRIARFYTPVVHICAAATFFAWFVLAHRPAQDSLMAAVAVLIITCPCALALAVPAVQVVATSRLFRAGILLKSPTALERLATVDTVVFDKTGTLTEPSLCLADGHTVEALATAAALATTSLHPLCRALAAAAGPVAPAEGVVESPGEGLRLAHAAGDIRLGSRAFCGLAPQASVSPELCLTRPHAPPTVFTFAERLRPDAQDIINQLRERALNLEIISGDHLAPVNRIAAALGITRVHARFSPVQKAARIAALQAAGHRVLMVGDGLNDGPCLAAADVSLAPTSAADISQTVADAVYQGDRLGPVAAVLKVARRARITMRQNLALSLGYNVVMLPLAACGYVTPWVAAFAMSCSSILVITNAVRLGGMRL